MPQQHNPGHHVQSLTLPQSRHNHRNTSAYIFPTVPTPRPPTDTGPRLAAGHCPASPPGPNAPTPRRNAPAPFKAHTCRRTPVPTAPTPRTTPPTPEPATRRALPHLTAGTQRSNIPPQLASAIQDTSPPPHNGPTPSQPSDHPAGAGFNRTAGHKKIRLCEPDLFICQ